MSALALFATGLGAGVAAGGVSCAAVQGGFLAASVLADPHPRGAEPVARAAAPRAATRVGVTEVEDRSLAPSRAPGAVPPGRPLPSDSVRGSEVPPCPVRIETRPGAGAGGRAGAAHPGPAGPARAGRRREDRPREDRPREGCPREGCPREGRPRAGRRAGRPREGRPAALASARRAAAPVAAFLAAKLASHTVLGAVLGFAGALLAPPAWLVAALLVAAGAAMAAVAVRLLRSGAPARCRGGEAVPAAPPWRAARLGAATVLVPCGATIGVELVAVAAGSPAGGAAAMAGFVLGTVPLFGAAGLALGTVRGLWRGRVERVGALALLAVAALTVLAGLRLAGVGGPGGAAPGPVDPRFVTVTAAGTQVITIWAGDGGYRPAVLTARAGLPTTLVLRTRGATGCTRAFVIPARGVRVTLPVTGSTPVDVGRRPPGRLRFVCEMGMYAGVVAFR